MSNIYPGRPFYQWFSQNYKKSNPVIPNCIDCLKTFPRYPDIIQIANNQVIPHNFYNKYIIPKTSRSQTHFQGIIRHPTKNYFFVSGSEMDKNAAQIFVGKVSKYLEYVDQANKYGRKKGPLGSNVYLGNPDASADELIDVFDFRDKDFWHAGGMDIEGDILAVPLENSKAKNSKIKFLSVASPTKIRAFSDKTTIERVTSTGKAGVASLLRLRGGRYLCGVWSDSDDLGERLGLYISKTKNIEDGFRFPRGYIFHTIPWTALEKNNNLSRAAIKFQTLQLFRDSKNRIFLLGAENKSIATPVFKGPNRIHLLQLQLDEEALAHDTPKFKDVKLAYLDTREFLYEGDNYNFNAGCGFHITPEKKIALYSIGHWRNNKDFLSIAEYYPAIDSSIVIPDHIDFTRIELYEGKHHSIDKRCIRIYGRYSSNLLDFSKIKIDHNSMNDNIDSVRSIIPKGVKYLLFENEGHLQNSPSNVFPLEGKGELDEIADLRKHSRVGGRVSSSRYESM